MQITKKIIAILIVGICSALIGCNDPKKPSEDNFKKAIQAYYDQAGKAHCVAPMFMSFTMRYPLEITKRNDSNKLLESYMAAGLLTRSEQQVAEKNSFSFSNKPPKPEDGWKYEVTAEGKKYLQESNSSNGNQKFCFGTIGVDQIKSFTEPADMMGMKVVNVNYTYKTLNIPDWINNPAIQKNFPSLQRELKESNKRAVLVLTNNGWVHERLMRDL